MNDKEPRKASDIILSLEAKIDQMVALHRSLDMNIKLLSNKINEMMQTADGHNIPMNNASPMASATAVDSFPSYEHSEAIMSSTEKTN